jgi:hypothetical protein
MRRFIGTNYTRYSTEDLEAYCEEIRQFAKALKGSSFLFSGSTEYAAQYRRRNLEYWSGGVVQAEDRLWANGNYTRPFKEEVFGDPWITEQGGNSAVLRILSPGSLDEHLPPQEMLAAAGEHVLPKTVLWQVIGQLLISAGLRFPGTRNDNKSEAAVFVVVRERIENSARQVRIMKNIQDKRPKVDSEQRLRELLATYTGGTAASNMKGKLWTIQRKLDDHFDFWLTTEAQRKRLEKKRGDPLDEALRHKTTAEVLRELADIYEQRAREASDEEAAG